MACAPTAEWCVVGRLLERWLSCGPAPGGPLRRRIASPPDACSAPLHAQVGFPDDPLPDQPRSCFRRPTEATITHKHMLRSVALARAEQAFRERMERKRRAEHAPEPQLPACPVPPWANRRAKISMLWKQGARGPRARGGGAPC